MPNHEQISLYCVDDELHATGFLLKDAIDIKDQLNICDSTDKWCIRKMSDAIKTLRESFP